jgi:hypothetical protein
MKNHLKMKISKKETKKMAKNIAAMIEETVEDNIHWYIDSEYTVSGDQYYKVTKKVVKLAAKYFKKSVR